MLFNQWGIAQQVILNPPPAPRVVVSVLASLSVCRSACCQLLFQAYHRLLPLRLIPTSKDLIYSVLFLIVFISCGCHNKLPQSGWLKTQECIFPQLWRPVAQNQGVHRATLPPEFLGEVLPCPSQVVVAPGIPWLWHHHSNLCSCLHWPSALCVSSCSFLPLIITLSLHLGHLNPIWSHLNPYINYLC